MPEQFNAPIPGQSLTKEPRNAPWERPPETSDPDEAIVHHLTRLSTPKVLNSLLDANSAGIPVSMLTELMLTGAVANGIHSIDISMIVAPVVHDYIVNLFEEEGVEFEEFFDDSETEEQKTTAATARAISGLRDAGVVEEEEPELEVLEEPLEVVEEEPRGLMAREKKV